MNDFLKVVIYGGLFIIPFLTLFVSENYFFPYITGKNFAFRIIVEIVFVAWAVLALADTRYRPKFSWITTSFIVFLVVMFFANLFGQHPHSSFWSNFERMDGYITLVHVFLFTLVLGSMLTTKRQWGFFLHTTLFVAFLVGLEGFSQYLGHEGGGRRIESYLGNAAYLSIFMLFHVFIAFWMFVESKVNFHRAIYGVLSLFFIFILIETGTRGTALGLAVGIAVMIAYIALFGSKYKEFRMFAAGALVLLVVGAGGFYFGKDTSFVQDNRNLARIANIDLTEDLKVRGTIWGMAWEGVQDRPLLGWGQSNFNYVFNEKYEPFLYDQEQWFDRAHSIVMDWLVAGGFLGLIAYLSILFACLYYIVVLPLSRKDDETFTVLERAVLLGILVGYFVHNLVVFDNIISYIFFAVILAIIHSRVATISPKMEKIKVDQSLIKQFYAPVAGALLVVLIYSIHVPAMRAASDIIAGYRTTNPVERLEAFDRAFSRNSFAHQEITEQLVQQTMTMAQDAKVPEEVRRQYIERSEEELKRLVEEKPNDARIHVFFGSFYRSVGMLDEAAEQMQKGRDLSPLKQSIISQQGVIAYSQGKHEEARDFFYETYSLDERNKEALVFYAAMLFLTNEGEKAKEFADDEDIKKHFAMNEFLLNTINQAGEFAFLAELYEVRVIEKPEVDQNWVSLSFLYYQLGETEKAIEALERGAEVRPNMSKTTDCFIENMKLGLDPQLGC